MTIIMIIYFIVLIVDIAKLMKSHTQGKIWITYIFLLGIGLSIIQLQRLDQTLNPSNIIENIVRVFL